MAEDIMQIELADVIDVLNRTPAALRELLHGLPKTWTEINEGENTWSPFDVVGHLIHGEQVNWIPRAKIILEFGEANVFEPFDRFAQFEASKGKTIEDLLEEFAQIRQQNIRTLNDMNLTLEDLQKVGHHPEFGRVTLGELLSTWVAHDLDHVVQISRTLAKGYKEAVGPWRAFLSVLK
jgi:DinB superfamily